MNYNALVCREYYKTHKQIISKQKKKYYEEHAEERREYQRKYRKENKPWQHLTK